MAWENLAAPPHGSTSRGSTLYTSLKCRMVNVDDELGIDDILDKPELAACRTSSDACKNKNNDNYVLYTNSLDITDF